MATSVRNHLITALMAVPNKLSQLAAFAVSHLDYVHPQNVT